ncbi:hypothetical protein [Listeria sp. PSOL-1]|uniref:hypothetical protein n=1 Tax=Listeria sp. PSOL-1 TaxID=1844999 RepID=UPI0013D0A348|nr:hypothetical protein [Listeria sp. PSOL-1]
MAKSKRFEIFYFPTKNGLLKIQVYGFNPCGSWGEVFAERGNGAICVKGFNRNKMITKAVKLCLNHINNPKNER